MPPKVPDILSRLSDILHFFNQYQAARQNPDSTPEENNQETVP